MAQWCWLPAWQKLLAATANYPSMLAQSERLQIFLQIFATTNVVSYNRKFSGQNIVFDYCKFSQQKTLFLELQYFATKMLFLRLHENRHFHGAIFILDALTALW